MEIEIVNWDKFNPRSDRSITVWFRFENSFFYDQKLWALTDSQRLLFIFLLCEASKVQKAKIQISPEMVAVLRKTTESKILSDLRALSECGVLHPPTGGHAPDKIHATQQDTTNKHNTTKQSIAHAEAFADFYSGYPRKVGKADAFRAYCRESKAGALPEEILSARERFKDHHAKSGTEPKYIPYPATFLSGWRDWLDPETGTTQMPKSQADLDYEERERAIFARGES